MVNEEETRFTIPHLAAEFAAVDSVDGLEDWPEDWFVDPHFQHFSEEDYYETDE